MPASRRRDKPGPAFALSNDPKLGFIRPSTAAASVDNIQPGHFVSVSMHIHTHNLLAVFQPHKASHAARLPLAATFGIIIPPQSSLASP